MKASSILITAVALLTAACASTPEKIPVIGDAATLNGTWQGEFKGTGTGRNGLIHFNLKAGQDTAFGDVLMISEEWQNRGSRYWENAPNGQKIQQPALLSVDFVHVSDVIVRGTMEPYHDVMCDCTVKVVFEGTLAWDVISGTYQARYSTGALAFEGTWRVKRVQLDTDAGINGGQPFGNW